MKIISKRKSGNRGSKWISPINRNAIYARDNFACLYCGIERKEGVTLTLDHVVPASLGGSDTAKNLVTVCGACNTAKSDKALSLFCREQLLSLSAVRTDIKNATARKVQKANGSVVLQEEKKAVDYFCSKFAYLKSTTVFVGRKVS